jgi:hypothetical protein
MLVAQLGSILMFIAGIALLTSILLRRTYRQLGRGRKRYDSRPIDAQPRPSGVWDGAKADSSAVIERQKVQLAELSRDINGQLDTKIMVLRELIAQSQQQIERMEELLGNVHGSEPRIRAGEPSSR